MGRKKQSDPASVSGDQGAPVDPYLDGILAKAAAPGTAPPPAEPAPNAPAPPAPAPAPPVSTTSPAPPIHPALLASADALLATMNNTSASTQTRLDAAEALLEFSDRLPADSPQSAGEFLFRLVDRGRSDAVNGEPRDRVRAARLILKYGQG